MVDQPKQWQAACAYLLSDEPYDREAAQQAAQIMRNEIERLRIELRCQPGLIALGMHPQPDSESHSQRLARRIHNQRATLRHISKFQATGEIARFHKIRQAWIDMILKEKGKANG